MVKYSDGFLYTVSVPVLPSIRESSVNYLCKNAQIESTDVTNEDTTSIKIFRLNNLTFPGYDFIQVGSISKLSLGDRFEDSIIYPDYNLKKALLKSLTWHLKLSPSEEMLLIVNALLSSEWHSLVLSEDSDSNIMGIKNRKRGE